MRLVAFALLLVLLGAALPAEAAAQRLVAHRQMTGAGWWADRFTTTDDFVTITYGATGASEVIGMIVHLYDGSGRLLRGTTSFFLGGSKVDVAARDGSVEVTTDGSLPGDRITADPTIRFTCGVTCNPSREFVLVVSAGGDNVTSWGYGLFLSQSALLANRSGDDAHAVSSRMFEGTVVHAGASALGEGATVVSGGERSMEAEGTFVGSFAKLGSTAPTRMSIETPQSTRSASCGPGACSVVITKGAPGSYLARYDDIDARGDEAYLAWADVSFP